MILDDTLSGVRDQATRARTRSGAGLGGDTLVWSEGAERIKWERCTLHAREGKFLQGLDGPSQGDNGASMGEESQQ